MHTVGDELGFARQVIGYRSMVHVPGIRIDILKQSIGVCISYRRLILANYCHGVLTLTMHVLYIQQ
jgi:hypothetical protein